MGYEPYLNDKDAAFARDEQNLMDYTHGYDGGYINQGYSNVAALPSQMHLAQVIEMRSKLNDRSIGKRKLFADERSAMADENAFEGFSSFVSGMAGKSNEEVAAAVSQRVIQDPQLLRNPHVKDAISALGMVDQLQTGTAQNRLARSDVDSKTKDLAFNEQTRSKRQLASELALDTQIAGTEVNMRKYEEALDAMDAGDAMKSMGVLYSGDAFGPDDMVQREQYSSVMSYFQRHQETDPTARDAMRKFARIGSGLSYATEIPKLVRLDVEQNQEGVMALRQAKVPIEQLGKDPESDKQIVAMAKQAAVAKGGAEGMAMMNALNAVSEYTGSVKQASEQKRVFFERLGKLNAMLEEGNPANDYKVKGLITDMTAMGDQVNGAYRTKLDAVLQRQKLVSNQTKIDSSVQRMKNEGERIDIAKQGLFYRQQAMMDLRDMRARGDKLSVMKYVSTLEEQGILDRLEGVPEGASIEQATDYLMGELGADDGTTPAW